MGLGSRLGGWVIGKESEVLRSKLSTLGMTHSASNIELCSLGMSSDESMCGWKALMETLRRTRLDWVVFAVVKAGDGGRA